MDIFFHKIGEIKDFNSQLSVFSYHIYYVVHKFGTYLKILHAHIVVIRAT